MLRSIFCLAALLTLGTAVADDTALLEARASFTAAYAAPTPDDSTDSDTLRAYPLYPWLQAARLKIALASDAPGAVAAATAFLASAGDAPQGRDLRRAQLGQLALAADWTGFLALWRDSASTETLACQKLDARRATGDTDGLAQEIADRWLKEAALPAACADALGWLRTQPAYTAVLVEQKLRARLLDGDSANARPLLAELPAERRARYETWLRQLTEPAGTFAALSQGTAQTLDSDGLADSYLRWAKRTPGEAAALLPALIAAQKLSLPQAHALQRNAALALAWDRDPRALPLFAVVPELLHDERSFEWRIRIALWVGDWKQALNWLVLLPEPLAAQPRWRYWTARALEAVGQKTEARQRYRNLAPENDSHGLLAAWRIGESYTPLNEPRPTTDAQRAALESSAALVRAREAWQTGFKSIASLEWREALETLPEFARPAMVREAAAIGWHDQAIVTATRLGVFRDLEALFPQPYAALVQQASSDSGIAAAWIYGVMRKESAFKPDASSSAGALGLLQMLPGTAAMTAKAAGLPIPQAEALKDPAINLPLGALHLREVLDKADGRWPMALAAYNAGPRAAARWLPAATMDADVWIENIPYNETRIYVQRILLHAAIYQWLATGKPVFAGDWLQPVPPAVSAAP